jgi:hypothetical protein
VPDKKSSIRSNGFNLQSTTGSNHSFHSMSWAGTGQSVPPSYLFNYSSNEMVLDAQVERTPNLPPTESEG